MPAAACPALGRPGPCPWFRMPRPSSVLAVVLSAALAVLVFGSFAATGLSEPPPTPKVGDAVRITFQPGPPWTVVMIENRDVFLRQGEADAVVTLDEVAVVRQQDAG